MGKSTINGPFSIAMLVYQRVIIPTDELHHFSEGWLNHQPDEIDRKEMKGRTESVASYGRFDPFADYQPLDSVSLEVPGKPPKNHLV
jgi:hypothetical protein